MNIIKKSVFLLTLSLLGCGSAPEIKEIPPTIVNAKIVVSKQVNPDVDNRASPVVVRIFDLKSLGTYNESDFYGLFDDYQSVLGSDLLGSEQFHLNPGDIHKLKHTSPAETQFIAVIAAYRDINQAVWRDSIVISAGKTTQLMVLVDALAISVWKK